MKLLVKPAIELEALFLSTTRRNAKNLMIVAGPVALLAFSWCMANPILSDLRGATQDGNVIYRETPNNIDNFDMSTVQKIALLKNLISFTKK